ncbi:MAG: tetratricopeptide repeat protein, partial [Candidatus Acidiferrales bacterium]
GVLLASFVLLALQSGATGFVSRMYHAKETKLGQEWFARGSADLKAGKAANALQDFRTALIYSPESDLYQLRLAEASAAAGHPGEARAYLVNLWIRRPGDGEVNLELARLSVHEGATEDAIRYYHGAIYGSWEDNPTERQLSARIEFCKYLLAIKSTAAAQSELISLASSVPPGDAGLQVQVGNFFLDAQEPQRALEEFRRAIAANRNEPGAQAGAGTAAFQVGDYAQAASYLERAVHRNPGNKNAAELLETARTIVNIDPFEMWLPDSQRRARTIHNFEQALKRLDECAQIKGVSLAVDTPNTELEKAYADAHAMQSQINERMLTQHPDLIQLAMQLVFRIEFVAADQCGAPKGVDLALQLLGAKYRGGKK